MKMKRLFGVIAVLCLTAVMLLAFTGCNGGDKSSINIQGNWKLALNETEITFRETQTYKPIIESMDSKLEFASDGKVRISGNVGDNKVDSEGTWTLDGEKLTITDSSGALGSSGTLTYTYKDNRFVSDTQKHICLVRA